MATLVLPPEIKRDINQYSGFITPSSRFAQKNLKGLFLTSENKKYLSKELYSLLTSEEYVRRNLAEGGIFDLNGLSSASVNDRSLTNDGMFGNQSSYSNRLKVLITNFIKSRMAIERVINNWVETYQLPFKEDLNSLNPVLQLNKVNRDFLLGTSQFLIQNPQNLITNFERMDPDTGKVSFAENDYDASSYADGTWHPEHLFTNNARNRTNPYWKPLEVNIYSDPDARGVDHIYNQTLYSGQENFENNPRHETPRPDRLTSRGQFSIWQYSVNRRHYDREDVEGLPEGGLGDRRVQTPHGFDMSSLRQKPSVRRRKIVPNSGNPFEN